MCICVNQVYFPHGISQYFVLYLQNFRLDSRCLPDVLLLKCVIMIIRYYKIYSSDVHFHQFFALTAKTIYCFLFVSQEEQRLAEEQSSLLNKAYQTLLKPLSRAIYMLNLHDLTIDEKDTISDPEFLMDIMSFNEQIDEASSASDITNIEETIGVAIHKCIKEISQAFKDCNIEEAKRSTIKLRYFTTIQERILDIRRRELG